MENKNPRHLFHKLFLSYSAVLILIVGVLILFFISSSRTRLLETNQDYAGKLCGEAVLEPRKLGRGLPAQSGLSKQFRAAGPAQLFPV